MLCERCYYYSHARVGWVCAYTGEYNPRKDKCPYFKEKSEARAPSVRELAMEIIRRLAEVDETDVEAIRELKLAARLVARRLDL